MSTPSRRGFVTRATGALLIPVWGNRALGRTVDPRVAKVLTSTLAIDMHHRILWTLERCPAKVTEREGHSGAGYGDRTRLAGLGSQSITTMLSPRVKIRSYHDRIRAHTRRTASLEQARDTIGTRKGQVESVDCDHVRGFRL